MREKHNTEEKYMGTKIVRHQILTWAAKLILKLKQIVTHTHIYIYIYIYS